MKNFKTIKEMNKRNDNPLVKEQNRAYMCKITKRMLSAITVVCCMALMSKTCFAEDGGIVNNAGSFDTVVAFIVTWVQRIAGVVGFIGAVQFGLAFKNDDADGKTRGLMTLGSGFIVIAICIAYNALFKQS